MELYIQRHAIAVPRGTAGYEEDSERPLTPKGEKRMRRIARGMKALDLSFNVILSSPYLRARQTADIVAEAFEMPKKLVISPALAVDGGPDTLIADLKKSYRTAASILLVGHEPYLSTLVSKLVTGRLNMWLEMKKGALCKLTVERLEYAQCATFNWLLTPAQLVRLR